MFIRRRKIEALIKALEYSKEFLEYANSKLTYFDKSGINKSVAEIAIKKAKEALDSVK